jgi:cyclopropane-fatty-acyl-phospholipid synthase
MTALTDQYEVRAPVPGPWRELPAAPHKRVHAAVARQLFLRAVHRLPVRVELPDGSIAGSGDDASPVMRIVDDVAFFRRLGADGLIGFGEAFMAGDWDADDPAEVLEPFAARLTAIVPAWVQGLRRFYVRQQPSTNENTVAGSRRNIERHYDLSNELFALFLDGSMTYSSALFEPGDTLERAQARKIDRLLDMVRVGAGTRVIEIGTGWGELAIRAARRGACVTTLTVSRAQATLARRRIEAAGVGDRVYVELRDYRTAEGAYDAVVSVEMIEAVGERYWPVYFSTLDRLVAADGRVGLQAIVLAHDRMEATRDQHTFISKYIFPGGALPSIRAIAEHVDAYTRLRITDRLALGDSYAKTLRAWRQRFDANADKVAVLGFDERFRRMWDFYLAYCEAGFAAAYLDVEQIVLTPGRSVRVACAG